MEHCLTTSRGKTHGKNFGDAKLSPKLGFDIAQDCSLGQCLTSSRAETLKKKKKKWDSNWGQNDLFYSNVLERPLKLVYFDVVSCCSLRNYILLTFVNIKSLSVP